MELAVVKRALQRHFRPNSMPAYERVLQSITSRGNIWATSQGEYIAWWRKRRAASLKVWVSDGQIPADTELEGAVLERVPNQFFPCGKTCVCGSCDSQFTGEVQIVIDITLKHKELLVDALQREGILNISIGESGDFLLSHELDPLLDEMETHLRQQMFRQYDRDILEVRDAVAAKLAERGLPLIRVWYHPQINGHVTKAVFSSRFDVDRAITNMTQIVQTECKYGASSTLYIRTDQPFYGDADVVALDEQSRTHEIALHAEFATHAARYGSDIAAAQAERAHLERVIGRPVTGISLHGGELTSNRSSSVWEVIEHCGFAYDTSHGPTPYYLPYRRLNKEGRLENTYCLRCHFRDIDLCEDPSGNGAKSDFYEHAVQVLDEVVEHNGIMVSLLHPMYFGFLKYLCCPRNLVRFAQFAPTYLRRVLKLRRGQAALAAGKA